MAPFEISVIIPNWNGKAYLEKCLGSLRNQEFSEFEVIVVDNGSTDGSVEFIHLYFSEVRVIAFDGNRGFSRAVNEGILRAKGEYILLLNNDVEADPKLLRQLHETITHLNDADFYACRMMNFNKPDLIDGAGDGFSRKGKAFRIGHGARYGPPYQRRSRVFGACAGAALYRKELFEKVGLFDEDFFAYHEDADWNFRANLMGYRCIYIPEAIVYHMGSSTTGSLRNEFTIYYNVQNMMGVLLKNMPLFLFIKYFPFILLGQVESFFRFFILLGFSRAYFNGFIGALGLLRKMLKKRGEIQKKRKISNFELEKVFVASERQKNVTSHPHFHRYRKLQC